MTLPRKGLRKLEINGKYFGWLIRSKPTYSQGAFSTPMTLAIQEMDCDKPKVLHVKLNIDRPDNWNMEHKTEITPKIIKEIILAAEKKGWSSNSGGSAFEYEHDVIKQL